MTTPYQLPPGVHCDDIADDPRAPAPLREFINYHRLPAVCRLPPDTTDDKFADHMAYVSIAQRPHVTRRAPPLLFATIHHKDGRQERIRVTFASRLGDVGVTADLKNTDRSYNYRVPLDALTDFSDQP